MRKSTSQDLLFFVGHTIAFYEKDVTDGELKLIREEMEKFEKEQGFWLEDYCLYMAIKDSLEGIAWNEWPEDLKIRKPEGTCQSQKRVKRRYQFLCISAVLVLPPVETAEKICK